MVEWGKGEVKPSETGGVQVPAASPRPVRLARVRHQVQRVLSGPSEGSQGMCPAIQNEETWGTPMNIHQRRRKVEQAINLLETVVADVLEETDGLAGPQILERAGWPRFAVGDDKAWGALEHVLSKMERTGEVVNDNTGPGANRWRLAG